MAVVTLSWILDGVIVILAAFFAAYLYMTRNFNYWTKRGVIGPKPIPFLGNFSPKTFLQKPASCIIEDLYFKFKGHNYVGFYLFDKPCLLVRDSSLVNRILVKDFNSFSDRFISSSDHEALASKSIFFIKGPHWKSLRTKLSPAMSSGKLKTMFQQIVFVGRDLKTHLKSLEFPAEGQVVEMHETWAKYTTDVITNCAYGLQANCLKDPDTAIRKFGKKTFDYNFKRSLELAAIYFAPDAVKLFGISFFENSSIAFLRKIFGDVLNQRIESGIRRNDLIDILIDLKKAQAQTDIDDPNSYKFDGDNLISQAAIFFTGGFETTSSTLSFCLYELALHLDIQSRLRKEITTALEENGGELRYEWVMQLPYLDMVVSETLRKYAVLGMLEREATSDYKMPDSDLVIEKGTPIFISVAGFHYDPEYFPDPEKFDPERFKRENKQERTSHVYLPFGAGPRNCLGVRFGMMSVKIGLINAIGYYEFSPCKETTIPLRLSPMAVFTSMQDGLVLNIRKNAEAPPS